MFRHGNNASLRGAVSGRIFLCFSSTFLKADIFSLDCLCCALDLSKRSQCLKPRQLSLKIQAWADGDLTRLLAMNRLSAKRMLLHQQPLVAEEPLCGADFL